MWSSSTIDIRPATPADLPYLPGIETASDSIFRTIDMSAISDFGGPTLESFTPYQARGHIWVATTKPPDSNNEIKFDPDLGEFVYPSNTSAPPPPPIAFIQIDLFQHTPSFTSVFLNQVSVHPDHARQGIGKQLIDWLELWASKMKYQTIDLTTFTNVPWNRTYYEKLGYHIMSDEELAKPESRLVKEELLSERKNALLGQWDRVAMRKDLEIIGY